MSKDWIEDCATAIWQLYLNWATPERDTIIDVIDWYVPKQEKLTREDIIDIMIHKDWKSYIVPALMIRLLKSKWLLDD